MRAHSAVSCAQEATGKVQAAIMLGKDADTLLDRLNVDDGDRLRMLQAWLYSTNGTVFAFTQGTEGLRWAQEHAMDLWDTIELSD